MSSTNLALGGWEVYFVDHQISRDAQARLKFQYGESAAIRVVKVHIVPHYEGLRDNLFISLHPFK